MKIDFANKTEREKDKLIGEGYAYLVEAAKQNKNIEIDDQEDNGYFRLISLLLPYLAKSYGEINNKDEADDFIRIEAGYFKLVKTRHKEIVLPKSIKTATKEDLKRLIDKAYEACEFYEIKDYELKPQEQRDMENYFNKEV